VSSVQVRQYPAPRQRPTRRQLEVLRAYIAAGSVAAAAHELGIAETTARQHLSGLYRRTECLNIAQAAYWLGCAERARRPSLERVVPALALAHQGSDHALGRLDPA
jgi:DNA-binding NarL/FixJ family response regulator